MISMHRGWYILDIKHFKSFGVYTITRERQFIAVVVNREDLGRGRAFFPNIKMITGGNIFDSCTPECASVRSDCCNDYEGECGHTYFAIHHFHFLFYKIYG